MSTNGDSAQRQRSAEERAEELMQRVSGQVTRVVGRFIGRAREELEDLVAEARALNERDRATESRSADRTGSGS